jgi:hypothetical protein
MPMPNQKFGDLQRDALMVDAHSRADACPSDLKELGIRAGAPIISLFIEAGMMEIPTATSTSSEGILGTTRRASRAALAIFLGLMFLGCRNRSSEVPAHAKPGLPQVMSGDGFEPQSVKDAFNHLRELTRTDAGTAPDGGS